MVSWYINQAEIPLSGAEVMHAMEPMYSIINDDPWAYYGITNTGKSRSNVRIVQKARFPISDMYFLALYYDRAEVRIGSVQRIGYHKLKLEDSTIGATCIIKAFGFRPSKDVDKLLHVKNMLGFWPESDHRRWVHSEASGGVDFQRIGSTSLSPAGIGIAEVPVHFLKHPEDFAILLAKQNRGSLFVPGKAEEDGVNYVLGPRMHTTVTLVIAALIPALQERDFGKIKRERQVACSPLSETIAVAGAEWRHYCELFSKDTGRTALEFPYTESVMQKLVVDSDAIAWEELARQSLPKWPEGMEATMRAVQARN